MNRKLIVALLAPTLLIGACGSDERDEYRAVCVDKYTNDILPDHACSSGYGGSPFVLGVPYYMPRSQYHDQVEVRHATRLHGGSTVMPTPRSGRDVAVQKVGAKKVTVFDADKQAGSSIKTNQDAKKSTTVKDRKTSKIGGFGSTSKSYSSTSRRK